MGLTVLVCNSIFFCQYSVNLFVIIKEKSISLSTILFDLNQDGRKERYDWMNPVNTQSEYLHKRAERAEIFSAGVIL